MFCNRNDLRPNIEANCLIRIVSYDRLRLFFLGSWKNFGALFTRLPLTRFTICQIKVDHIAKASPAEAEDFEIH